METRLNLLNAPEKSRLQNEISFGFASHWLENWCGIMKPITKRSGTLRSQLMARAVPIRKQYTFYNFST